MIYYGPPNTMPGKTAENVFAMCHIKATFNNTFIHVTDLSGRETYARVTGGMKVKADREESSPYAGKSRWIGASKKSAAASARPASRPGLTIVFVKLCSLPSTSTRSCSWWALTRSTSSCAARAAWRPRPPAPARSLRSERSRETDLRLAGLRMSLPFPPTLPERDTVAEEEDCEN